MKINPKLKDFFTKGKARIRVLYGGRSSSKSHSVARQVLIWALTYHRMRIVVIRQFQNKIEESFFLVLKDIIYTEGYEKEFDIRKDGIRARATGSTFSFYGIARNLDEIKGLENVNVVILEEMTNLTKAQWDILYPTFIRVKNNVIFVLFNPGFYSDFSYQNFIVNPLPNSIVQKINYTDNPYLTPETLDAIEAEKRRDFDNYLHVYEGEPKDSNANSIFKRKWIMAAVNYDIKAAGQRVFGVDPSGQGEDRYVVTARVGVVVKAVAAWKSLDTDTESAHKVIRLARKARVEHIKYDSGGGYGAVLESEVRRLTDIKLHPVSFAGEVPDVPYTDSNRFGTQKVTLKDLFGSYKAMLFWLLSDRFRKTYEVVQGVAEYPAHELISLQLKDKAILQQLIDELMVLEYKPDMEGKIQMESKKDLRKRINKSPDLADSLAICFDEIKTYEFFFG